ncbi:MAG: bifunctional serine/threonine-protein kinase/ABC transporter substrate-binding protein [Anaerolineae bacterium]|jgi:serine/threonine protein kinase|nr:bifunctional serine/threonine-protein kinase/ABC transporter substrate-binding protein [Anaerolineae bacterium]
MLKIIDNRYQILEKIGEGGMGAVYLAEDTRLRRKVALKRLLFQGKPADEKQFQQRFEREALEMASFQHPNIVAVYDYGKDEEGIYLILEYMPGGSLSQKMRHRLNISEIIDLLKPLCAALQAIHDRGRVHRDIKPANILFDAYGTPKLADFGVVKLLESQEEFTLTATGMAVGTPAYMAPELISGVATPAADQYALGVVLYEIATGKKPFKGRTPMETMLMQQTRSLPDPKNFQPDIPQWLCHILRRMLAKDPTSRFTDMNAVIVALDTQKPDENSESETMIVNSSVAMEPLEEQPTTVAPIIDSKKSSLSTKKLPRWILWASVGVIVFGGMITLGMKIFQGKPMENATLGSITPTVESEIVNEKPNLSTPTEQVEEENGEYTLAQIEALCAEDPYGCAIVESGEKIAIGFAGPVEGEYAFYGQDISNGADLAIEQFNQSGGLYGWNVELVIEDTGGVPEYGHLIAEGFVQNHNMIGIIGHILSGESETAIPIYSQYGFPMMSPSAMRSDLTTLNSDVFNRLIFTEPMQAERTAKMMVEEFGLTRIAVVHDSSPSLKDIVERIQTHFEALGGEIVLASVVSISDTDYSAMLEEIVAENPQTVYSCVNYIQAAGMLHQWNESGLRGIPFWGCDAVFDDGLPLRVGEPPTQIIAASYQPYDDNNVELFKSLFIEAYGVEPGELTPYSWYGYDAAQAILLAMQEVGVQVSDRLYFPRSEMVEAVRNSSFEGLSGKVLCDTTGECNQSGPYFYELIADRGGSIQWVEMRP